MSPVCRVKCFCQGDGANCRFTSKEQDEETGLYYFGARYYDAKLSRWVSADPAFEKYVPDGGESSNLPGIGGVFNTANMNPYHYACNQPVNLIDPDGNWVQVAIALGGFALGLGGQYLQDEMVGRESSDFEDYLGAGVSGMITTLALFSGKDPIHAGVVGAGAGNLIKQFISTKRGHELKIDWADFTWDVGMGAMFGRYFPGKHYQSMLRTGEFKVSNMLTTKLRNGKIHNMTINSFYKMFYGQMRQSGTLQGIAFSGVINNISKNIKINYNGLESSNGFSGESDCNYHIDAVWSPTGEKIRMPFVYE